MTGTEGRDLSDGSASGSTADSLDLLVEQDRVLADLMERWRATQPSGDRRDQVKAAWDHGTFGKLLLEHAAVRLGAKEDIARVLREHDEDDLADQLTDDIPRTRRLVDQLFDESKGTSTMSLAVSASYASLVDELRQLLESDAHQAATGDRQKLASALGGNRSQLWPADKVAESSPTRPGAEPGWYDSAPFLRRLHARYDHIRGMPWANSPQVADTEIADRFSES